MLTRRIIPCLDVSHGRVVKGIKFQNLKDSGDPTERALDYQAQGADELVVLDVSATIEERKHHAKVIQSIRRDFQLPLTAGGGVQGVLDAGRLLEAGADKVAVNTAAVERPELLEELARQFGCQCVVLAIDARSVAGADWAVVVRAGSEMTPRSVVDWAKEATSRGAGEILLTSWDRDGTRLGYDLPLLTAVSRAVTVPVIASGGADHVIHLKQAFDAGADAVLAASIFHEGQTTVRSLKAQLSQIGVRVRQ